LDPVNPPLQMASRSNQPFFHNAPDRQTDRQVVQATKPLPISCIANGAIQ